MVLPRPDFEERYLDVGKGILAREKDIMPKKWLCRTLLRMARLAMNECIRRKEFDTLCCSEAVLSFQLARESYQTILDICWTPHLQYIVINHYLLLPLKYWYLLVIGHTLSKLTKSVSEQQPSSWTVLTSQLGSPLEEIGPTFDHAWPKCPPNIVNTVTYYNILSLPKNGLMVESAHWTSLNYRTI